MMSSYARYLHPMDADTPRAGTIVRRLSQAIIGAGLAGPTLTYTPSSLMLTPAGPLETMGDAAGLFEPRLHIALYGEPRTFTNPYAERGATLSFCPKCDTPVPTRGHLRAHRLTRLKYYVPIQLCTMCDEPFDVDRWPRSAEPVAFRARLTISLIAQQYEDTAPSIKGHCPELVQVVADTLGEDVAETLIAAAAEGRRLFYSTVPGMPKAGGKARKGRRRSTPDWQVQAHVDGYRPA